MPLPHVAGPQRHRSQPPPQLACEDSLRRLQTDHIDLYQIHMQDARTPEDEVLRALDDLVRQGKVLYIGCSNYTAYRLMDSLWTSRTEHLERFVTMQMQYSLLRREIEREHTPIATRYGVGILPWSPLAGGLLSGKYRRDVPPPDGSRLATDRWKANLARYSDDRSWNIVEASSQLTRTKSPRPRSRRSLLAPFLRKSLRTIGYFTRVGE